MRRRTALLGLPLLMILAACAPAGTAGPSGDPVAPSEHRWARFDQRAAEVAESWRRSAASTAWRTGYVPLGDATVLVGDPGFSGDTKQAFLNGWYRDQVALPARTPAPGTVRFPDGTLTVPLISAAEAYRQLDRGDPPPCAARPARPPATGSGPDSAVSNPADTACIPLTVTGVKLGTAQVATSRGPATVPAWLFTVEELATPVARLAVAPSAVAPVPSASVPASPVDGLVVTQELTAADGTTLSYKLGIGACDSSPTALVAEFDDIVVIGGGIIPSTGICTAQLVLAPVSVTLDAPLGARPVLDGVTGQPMLRPGG
ncbi:hypothetical protein [Micromonospora echinofusca]|uniref:Lipoprotein n=1 Tax=Micromonospora echinofusca TaxID=47858 RepID=A0ABS3VXG8_MICEH|nr:hypothetical protein [Micromonospora echinofusca]MBO4209242.1 hypothetical protein [Micromonospora echinofusca]